MTSAAQVRPDETFCGPLCQHPSCWESQRRIVRGVPHTSCVSKLEDSDDEDLPTQKVLNLLETYGPDPTDRYPTKYGGRQIHDRSKSVSALNRVRQRENNSSLPGFKSRVPNATPVTPMPSTNTGATSAPSRKKGVGKVEVQEVFEVSDLNSSWNETFTSKKKLVWVPNPNKKKKKKKSVPKPEEDVPTEGPPRPLDVRDVTEIMVPREIEWERERSTTHPNNPRRSPISFYTMSPISSHKLSQQGYHGLHELLDLPRDVLAQLVTHISESDMLDRERFAEALLRTLPMLQQENTTVSLAYGNVLQQHQIPLENTRKRDNMIPIPVRQVFLTDEDNLRAVHMERMNQTGSNLPSTYRSYLAHPTPTPRDEYRPVVPPIDVRTPLPDIPKGRGVEDETETTTRRDGDGEQAKPKAANISLGLQPIPSGVKHTRTFNYRKQKPVDFTLGRVPSPPPAPRPQSKPEKQRPDSPTSTERSSLVVTMPTIPAVSSEDLSHITPGLSNSQDGIGETKLISSDIPLSHSSSTPAFSHATKRDAGWSNKRMPQIVNVKLPQQDPPLSRTGTQDSPFMPRPPPTTPNLTLLLHHASYTPDHMAGTLGPIHETENVDDDIARDFRAEGHKIQSRGGRSVRFATGVDEDAENEDNGDVTATPNESEPGVSVANSPAPHDVNINYIERQHSEYEDLMVVGKGAGQRDVVTPREGREYPPTKVPTGTPTLSPEPWPQVDEDAYRMMETPPTGVAVAPPPQPSRPGSEPVRMPTTPGAVSNGSAISKKIWGAEDTDSPGPPPPSPEPEDAPEDAPQDDGAAPAANRLTTPHSHSGSTGSNLGMLKEETSESDMSHMTISAMPPHSLDDMSRINTPNSYASKPLFSRDATCNDMAPLTEAASAEDISALHTDTAEEIASATAGLQPRVNIHPNARSNSPTAQQMLDVFETTEEQLDAELRAERDKLDDDDH